MENIIESTTKTLKEIANNAPVGVHAEGWTSDFAEQMGFAPMTAQEADEANKKIESDRDYYIDIASRLEAGEAVEGWR
ncbi:MAG: hypothetical protein GY774_39945 [Planctomycetes bacterium]|nr:hypothetical protein [Planctomycetota bacterium]